MSSDVVVYSPWTPVFTADVYASCAGFSFICTFVVTHTDIEATRILCHKFLWISIKIRF